MSQTCDLSNPQGVNAPTNLWEKNQKSPQCDPCLTFEHPFVCLFFNFRQNLRNGSWISSLLHACRLLRSTKWNANLNLTCGFSELVSLCTVLGRKIPHSCKDTKMATPLDFCRGMSRPVNWYRLMLRRDKTCAEHVSMWAGHVSSSFRWIFFWLLSIQSPYASLLCALSVRFKRI